MQDIKEHILDLKEEGIKIIIKNQRSGHGDYTIISIGYIGYSRSRSVQKTERKRELLKTLQESKLSSLLFCFSVLESLSRHAKAGACIYFF